MQPFDPFAKPPKVTRPVILFVTGQDRGIRNVQEDAVDHFGNECFVIADGVGSIPHADVACRLACDTALWAYKYVRQRRCYWEVKQALIKRIFRSTNLTIWQKQREHGLADGMATALTVCIVLPKAFWIGSAGNCSSFLYRDGLIDALTPLDIDESGHITHALGFQRLGLPVHFAQEQFVPRDCILLATDGVADYVSEDDMRMVFDQTGETEISMQKALSLLLQTAQKNGSDDNMTATLIKQVIVTE